MQTVVFEYSVISRLLLQCTSRQKFYVTVEFGYPVSYKEVVVLVHRHCRFLRGVSIACYASPVLAIVGMSVRPSVTPWHWVKTAQARIMKSSPTDSPMNLVFQINSWSRNSRGFIRHPHHLPRAFNESGVGKIRSFQPISRRISEMMQDTTKVTIND